MSCNHVVNTELWGKKREVNGVMQWLPLAQHLEDTGNVIGQLWDHWLSDGQRRLIEASLSKHVDAKKLSQFLGCIHDIGKATPVFQFRKSYSNSEDLDIALKNKLATVGFTNIDDFIKKAEDCSNSHHTITGQAILSNAGVPEGICAIVGAHHGKPLDDDLVYKSNESAYTDHYYQSETESENSKLWKKLQNDILDWALERNDFSNVDDLPEISEPAQVLLCGLVIMADWIASNEHYFPLIPIEKDLIENQEERYRKGWEKWLQHGSKDVWESLNCCSNISQIYKHRFGFLPNSIQTALYNVISHCKEPGIFILESSMGSGKTEASLIAAEQLANLTGRSGVFFGLPTQATSNGMFRRVEDWLKSVNSDFQGEIGLRLVHGKAELNADYAHLPHGMQNMNDGSESRSSNNDVNNNGVILNDWFTGRKTAMLDDFVVGTVDQFLLASLKQKHLMLRHLGLSKKVVIIDEVHAYDAYMNKYLEESLIWMAAYGVPVVLLSATLPAKRRKELIKAYMCGLFGFSWRECDKSNVDFETNNYPLITYSDKNCVKQKFIENDASDNKSVSVRKITDDSLHESLVNELKSLLNNGGIAGIIVNTVKRAQEIYNACVGEFTDEEVIVIHSQFIATDRVRKEQQICNMIGKNAHRPVRAIIIGTQVLEQSLDVDFDVLFTDLAPIDLLLQRTGRLHRHTIERPDFLKKPILYVLGTSECYEFDKGSESIYSKYLLMRTQYYLPDVINMPQDISRLVQIVYGDNPLELQEDLRYAYVSAKREHDSVRNSNESAAKTYRIENPKSEIGKKSIVGLLKNSITNESDEFACAQVRNSGESIEVIAVKKVGSGYGTFHDCEDISQNIDYSEVAMRLAQETVGLPWMFTLNNNRIEETINELERIRKQKQFQNWDNQPWLRGSLVLLFDENNICEISKYRVVYSEKSGIVCIKSLEEDRKELKGEQV